MCVYIYEDVCGCVCVCITHWGGGGGVLSFYFTGCLQQVFCVCSLTFFCFFCFLFLQLKLELLGYVLFYFSFFLFYLCLLLKSLFVCAAEQFVCPTLRLACVSDHVGRPAAACRPLPGILPGTGAAGQLQVRVLIRWSLKSGKLLLFTIAHINMHEMK